MKQITIDFDLYEREKNIEFQKGYESCFKQVVSFLKENRHLIIEDVKILTEQLELEIFQD